MGTEWGQNTSMSKKWITTGVKGIRYREHPTRRHGIKKDRYYAIRFQLNGKRVEEGLGWTSEGWDLDQATEELSSLRKAARVGDGPTRLQEKRDIAEEQRRAEEIARREDTAMNITFKSYAEELYFPVAEPGWKPETARKHKEHCSTWLYPHLGDMPLRSVGISQLNKIKATMMAKKRSPRTMQAVFRTFSMIWTSARDAEIVVADSPTKKKSFKLPKIDNERLRFLKTNETKRLIDCIRKRSTQVADMALVSLESGLRFGEVATLTWATVDMPNKSLQVIHTKGKKDRIVPMTKRLYTLFQKLKKQAASDLVFPNQHGNRHKQVPSLFKRGLKDSKLNEGIEDRKLKATFHTLRHTYASRMVQQGVDLYKLQKLLGHSTPALTARYAKLADDDLRKAVEQMETREKMKASKTVGKIVPMK